MEVHGGPSNRKHRKKADPFWLHFFSADEKEVQRVEQLRAIPISNVGLSVRIANTLENYGVLTLGDLANLTAEDLIKIPNLGEITIRHCQQLLAKLNLPNRFNR